MGAAISKALGQGYSNPLENTSPQLLQVPPMELWDLMHALPAFILALIWYHFIPLLLVFGMAVLTLCNCALEGFNFLFHFLLLLIAKSLP